MSRNRGLDLQNGLARYLRQWWPGAESAGAGRPGSDVLGVVGVVFENKTADRFDPLAFVRQAKEHAATPGRWHYDGNGRSHVERYPDPIIPVVVYWPRGVGEKNAGNTLSIVPTEVMVRLLKEAGY